MISSISRQTAARKNSNVARERIFHKITLNIQVFEITSFNVLGIF